jgi:hypothetical protein
MRDYLYIIKFILYLHTAIALCQEQLGLKKIIRNINFATRLCCLLKMILYIYTGKIII